MVKNAEKDKKQLNDVTEIVAVIDRSGSMQAIVSDAIGGFNRFIEEQKKLPDKALFTLIEFNNEAQIKYNGVDLSEVEPYTVDTYVPHGTTALYDAVGKGIGEASRRDEKRDVIVAILTDGLENSSKEVTKKQVGDMIEKYTKEGWQFIFLAAGFSQFEAEQIATSINIQAGMTMAVDHESIDLSYRAMSDVVSSYRTTRKVDIDKFNK